MATRCDNSNRPHRLRISACSTRSIECVGWIDVVAYVYFERAQDKLRFAPGADPAEMPLPQNGSASTSAFHALTRESTGRHSEMNGLGLAWMCAAIPANGIPARGVEPASAGQTPASESEPPHASALPRFRSRESLRDSAAGSRPRRMRECEDFPTSTVFTFCMTLSSRWI